MSFSRRASALLLSAAALATSALIAPTASAAESQCPTGFSCVWTDANYSSSYSGRGNANYTEWYAVGGYVFNDTISSLKNRYPGRKIWFQHADRGGAQLWITQNYKIANLQNAGTGLASHPNWNDFISSVD
ncbi:Peptidase inhibitor family I36 [Rathayibacter oskolensis]|uniref:Peptidase inhibitor family I36 n=1 Tax=Rathayibacter oskolensis TaxID=1891671 RepID=A0A1X7P4Q9_9MICO|nr:peptidase inhibitor family I36 protein [Rathayibacter oskolensis]SMH45853.1 Peptidase inhibitor family I36 [Rathayibacter oskolensis]